MAEGLTEVVDFKVDGARSGAVPSRDQGRPQLAIGGDDDVLGSPVVWTVDLIVLLKLAKGHTRSWVRHRSFPTATLTTDSGVAACCGRTPWFGPGHRARLCRREHRSRHPQQIGSADCHATVHVARAPTTPWTQDSSVARYGSEIALVKASSRDRTARMARPLATTVSPPPPRVAIRRMRCRVCVVLIYVVLSVVADPLGADQVTA